MADKNVTRTLGLACLLIFFLAMWLYFLGKALIFLSLAFFLAYLVYPLVRILENRGINRMLTVGICFILTFGSLTAIVIAVFPFLLREASDFIAGAPELLAKTEETLTRWMLSLGIPLPDETFHFMSYISQNFQALITKSAQPLVSSAGFVFSSLLSFFSWMLQLLLLPIFFVYWILDYEHWIDRGRSLIPLPWKTSMEFWFKELDEILTGYIRGQFLVCLILTVIYSLGYGFIGIKYGFILGCIAGLLSFVPYLGSSIGLGGALLLITVFDGGLGIYLKAILVFGIAQSLEGYVLTPRLVGNRVGLSPLATILAIIVGANLAGFLGMIFAIPLAAFLKKVFAAILKYYYSYLSQEAH